MVCCIIESNQLDPLKYSTKSSKWIYLHARKYHGVYIVTRYNLTAYNFNLEIRVGRAGEELGKNKICAVHHDFRGSNVANITCLQPLFGDWISINKSSSNIDYYQLVLVEISVFDSKYSSEDISGIVFKAFINHMCHTCIHNIHIYMFIVVNFDALAQASDFLIERRQVIFLCWMQDSNPRSQTPNRQQTECPLTNRLSYRGSS